MGNLIESCITEDFDIYIGDDKDKIRKTMNIMSLDDSHNSNHTIKMMYWEHGNDVSVHKDNAPYKFFNNLYDARKHFEDLGYIVYFNRKYRASTGCFVEEYNITRNKKLEESRKKPYFDLLTDLNKLNNDDFFTIARVTNDSNCVELHYNSGQATIEYGQRIKENEWEDFIEEIDWYNEDMTEEEISNKLFDLYDHYYGEEYEI